MEDARIQIQECTSAYSREEVVNCNCFWSLCVCCVFPLTLNALVPGCCCFDAGFWWSVAIVNGSARMKLKRNTDKTIISLVLINIYGCLHVFKKFCIFQTSVNPYFNWDFAFYYFLIHMCTKVPIPRPPKQGSPPSEHRITAMQHGILLVEIEPKTLW